MRDLSLCSAYCIVLWQVLPGEKVFLVSVFVYVLANYICIRIFSFNFLHKRFYN